MEDPFRYQSLHGREDLIREVIAKKILNEYDLKIEYGGFFGQKINEYNGKSAWMKEKEFHYLNEYTRFIRYLRVAMIYIQKMTEFYKFKDGCKNC